MFLPEKFLLGDEEYSHPEDDEYFHPEDEESYPEDEEFYPEHENSQGYSCDICERDFHSKFQYDKHLSEHKTCNLDGCQFTAHEKIVEKHILMQHVTGLYDKIRNINTPEDIAKWIEQRKRRYPSKENVLERQEKQKELLERGARIKKKDNRFGKDKFRLTKANSKVPPPKLQRPKRPFIVEKKPVSLINEKLDWNGAVFPFRGTSMLEIDAGDNRESDFEDDEWQPAVKPVQVGLNNALGALMGAYMSDEECSDGEVGDQKLEEKKIVIESKPNVETTVNIVSTNSDDEPPTEVKIEKTNVPETAIVVEEPLENKIVPSTKTRKRHRPEKRRTKPDRFKNNRRNAVQKNPTGKSDLPYAFKRRKVTLLEKLLESEIRQERNILLQCVRYVVKNNFFRPAENNL